MAAAFENPPADCALCPRLVDFRRANQAKFPDFHNAPVAGFGPMTAGLLVVGLAPGLKGANRTGRPFTGDYAGDLLYPTLIAYGLAKGTFGREATDGLVPTNVRVTNAVRCVPPQNKVTGAEAAACRPFLVAEIAAMENLRAIVALGRVAHDAVLTTLKLRKAAYPFGHAALHPLPNGLALADSYHCSRYNTNTGRLTEAMFHAVFDAVTPILRDGPTGAA